jgi:hypothetical protein
MPARDSSRVVVRRPMNDHGTMTVELCGANETRHVCEYATPDLRRRLAVLPAGTEVLLSMSRIGVRANVWRAVAAVETPAAETGGAGPGERMAQRL